MTAGGLFLSEMPLQGSIIGMFSLNYQLMTQTLQRMHYTGMAQAKISSGPLAGGTLLLQVQGGELLASIIIMSDGKHITDAQLIEERLPYTHVLEWELIANPVSMSPEHEVSSASHPALDIPPPAPLAPPRAPTPIPGEPGVGSFHDSAPDVEVLSPHSYPRRAPVDPAWMSTWPFIYRQVYNLSTGHYSERDIGRLLRYPLSELTKVFDDLERMNVIERRT